MLDVSREDIISGSIPRTLVFLAVPLVAQNLAMVSQQVIDTLWVGRLSEEAVAAIGLTLPIGALAAIPLGVIFAGSQIITSQYVGSDRIEDARRTPVHASILALLAAICVALLVYAFGFDLIALVYSSSAVVELASIYLVGWGIALVFASVSDGIESGFAGYGDTRAVLVINLVAIVINVVLDPFFIFGWGPFPEWGVFGAAIATGVGYLGGGVLALAFALGGRYQLRLTRRSLGIDPALFLRIVRVGAPLAGKGAGRQLARVLMVSIVTVAGGAAALAAYTIGARLSTIAFVPASGLSAAATSMVGQNVGSGSPRRAERVTWTGVVIGGVALAFVGAVQWALPGLITRTFIPDLTSQTLELSTDYLRILAYGYWTFAVIYVVEAGFSGAGRTDLSMYSTVVQYWLVRLPIAVLGVFVFGMGVHAVFWAVTLSNIVAAVGLLLYYWHATGSGLLEEAVENAVGQ